MKETVSKEQVSTDKERAKELTVSEIIETLRKEGITISPRQFFYFRFLGLIPFPKLVGEGKRKGVKRYYPSWIISRLKFLVLSRYRTRVLIEIFSRDLGEIEVAGEKRKILSASPVVSLNGKKFLSILLDDGTLWVKEVKDEDSQGD